MDEVADYRRRVLRPNLDARWNGTTFRTNSLGYRGPEVSRSKAAGDVPGRRARLVEHDGARRRGRADLRPTPRRLARRAGRAGAARRGREPGGLGRFADPAVAQAPASRRPASIPTGFLCDITALDFSLEEQHLRWVVGKGVEIPFDSSARPWPGRRSTPTTRPTSSTRSSARSSSRCSIGPSRAGPPRRDGSGPLDGRDPAEGRLEDREPRAVPALPGPGRPPRPATSTCPTPSTAWNSTNTGSPPGTTTPTPWAIA